MKNKGWLSKEKIIVKYGKIKPLRKQKITNFWLALSLVY